MSLHDDILTLVVNPESFLNPKISGRKVLEK